MLFCLPADIRSKLLPVLLEWDMQQAAAEGGEDEGEDSGVVGGKAKCLSMLACLPHLCSFHVLGFWHELFLTVLSCPACPSCCGLQVEFRAAEIQKVHGQKGRTDPLTGA